MKETSPMRLTRAAVVCLVMLSAGCRSGSDASMPDGATAGRIGDPCHGDADCKGESCVADWRFPGGSCPRIIAECPAEMPDTACPSGSFCTLILVDGVGAGDQCLPKCSVDADCRVAEGYRCCASKNDATKSC